MCKYRTAWLKYSYKYPVWQIYRGCGYRERCMSYIY